MNKSFYNSGRGLFPDSYHKHRNSNKQILIDNNYLSKICIYLLRYQSNVCFLFLAHA